jgi:transposase-like protein
MFDNLPPSDQMSKRLFELLDGQGETEVVLSELMRRGAERLLQQALEEEVTDFLGRERYERADEESSTGYRNRYRDRTIKTAEGRLTVRRPRVRESGEPFESRLLARIDGLEERIRRMALEMYVRGSFDPRHPQKFLRRDARRSGREAAALPVERQPPYRSAP